MAKCENCADTAIYSVENPGAQHQKFCKEHLPKIINQMKLPDYIKKIDSTEPAAPKAKKKVAAKVEEPAPIVEDTTPAPVEVEAVAEVVEETPVVTE